jgi:hypothetical protein
MPSDSARPERCDYCGDSLAIPVAQFYARVETRVREWRRIGSTAPPSCVCGGIIPLRSRLCLANGCGTLRPFGTEICPDCGSKMIDTVAAMLRGVTGRRERRPAAMGGCHAAERP